MFVIHTVMVIPDLFTLYERTACTTKQAGSVNHVTMDHRRKYIVVVVLNQVRPETTQS